MSGTFAAVVEEVQKLSKEEKAELHSLLEKYLVEARRDEIHENYLGSKKRLQRGELKFSENIDDLHESLDE